MKTIRKSGLISLLFALFSATFISCSKEEIEEEKSLTDVFVAHAGGAIEGFIYTNCLEALNLSYSKGCRMFELDILETAEGNLVAAHTWAYFKTITNYPGPIDGIPMTEEEFLSSKIREKFTPMNMADVIEWLAKHKDAVLMTDKINEPAMLKGFPFKDRLVMELFTWEAVEEAIKEGIKPMPSDNLIFQLDNDSIPVPGIEKKLSDLNIKYISISRRFIENNKEFLKRLKKKGIKTYVYHVGWDEGKDEWYVFENEMDYITGVCR